MKRALIFAVFSMVFILSFVAAQGCNEDDAGIDSAHYGVISDPILIFANDECNGTKILREYYCNSTSNLAEYVDLVCGEGCSGGICINGNVSCIVKKCSDFGYECGEQSLGCPGTTENCGSCAGGLTCQSGKCVSSTGGGNGGGSDNDGGSGGGGFATTGNCTYTTSVGECIDGVKVVNYTYRMKFSGRTYTRAEWSSLTGPGTGKLTGFVCPEDTSEEVPCPTVSDEILSDVIPEKSASGWGKYALIAIVGAGIIVGGFFAYRYLKSRRNESAQVQVS